MALKNQRLVPGIAPAEETEPAEKLAPEEVVGQIRWIRSQIEEVHPLTPEQKRIIRGRTRKQSEAVLASSINMIGALDNVGLAIGQTPDDVRQLQVDWNRWTAVADELRTLLNGVEGANLVRLQRLSLLSAQAYSIGTQLARDPAYAVLLPHVQEVRRLKSFSNRKKKVEDAQPPDPTPDDKPEA